MLIIDLSAASAPSPDALSRTALLLSHVPTPIPFTVNPLCDNDSSFTFGVVGHKVVLRCARKALHIWLLGHTAGKMPVALMDGGSYTDETGGNNSPSDSLSTSLGLARITSAPDSIRPGTTRHGASRPPLYPYSKSPTRLGNTRRSAESLASGTRGAEAASTPLATLVERPEKRPRLNHQLDRSLGKPFKPGSSLEVRLCACITPYPGCIFADKLPT